MFQRIRIRSYEVGLHFYDGEFKGLMREGRHWLFNPLLKHHVDVVSQRAPWLEHGSLDMIVKSGLLDERATVLDLKDHQVRVVVEDGYAITTIEQVGGKTSDAFVDLDTQMP